MQTRIIYPCPANSSLVSRVLSTRPSKSLALSSVSLVNHISHHIGQNLVSNGSLVNENKLHDNLHKILLYKTLLHQ